VTQSASPRRWDGRSRRRAAAAACWARAQRRAARDRTRPAGPRWAAARGRATQDTASVTAFVLWRTPAQPGAPTPPYSAAAPPLGQPWGCPARRAARRHAPPSWPGQVRQDLRPWGGGDDAGGARLQLSRPPRRGWGTAGPALRRTAPLQCGGSALLPRWPARAPGAALQSPRLPSPLADLAELRLAPGSRATFCVFPGFCRFSQLLMTPPELAEALN
jgi:hypothetical protein